MPTKYPGTEEEKLILNAYIAFLRAYNSVLERLSDLLTKERLTFSQFGVLEALYFLGPMNQKTVSKKILKSASNICTVLENLDFNGKIVKPFSTHEGSGLGNIMSDIERICNGADIKNALAIQGSEAKNSKEKLESWCIND